MVGIVVDSGIAGITCARELAAAGVQVRVLNRGRRGGGRMAVRHVDDRPVDVGASHLTAQDPVFQSVVGLPSGSFQDKLIIGGVRAAQTQPGFAG